MPGMSRRNLDKIITYKEIKGDAYDSSHFTYQPQLTNKLRTEKVTVVSQEWINEVVLWKLNRYSHLNLHTLELLNDARVKEIHLDKSFTRQLLIALLNTPGIRLPMASTILRFRNSSVFQIIDQRAYRFVFGRKLPIMHGNSIKSKEKQIDIYFEYLKELRNISHDKEWPFEQLDEILYVLDKHYNVNVRIDN
jgi:hypothetical protein